ncbi:hypothetical protein VNO78_30758 [Psophocarpus tetragonolobus]|uniref:Transcription factor CBF/NF-Y/archaeal histone domain-containing protein n=1 Tax=Psophocarpus tetragonolobus TaxID=3891 RepID=A0AAN9X792_PSOTE
MLDSNPPLSTNKGGAQLGIASANLVKIMRKVLPPQAKLTEETKQTMQVCVSEFISFVTCEANELCRKERRKIVTAEDIICAMDSLGFDDYVEPLILFLERYRDKKDETHNVTSSHFSSSSLSSSLQTHDEPSFSGGPSLSQGKLDNNDETNGNDNKVLNNDLSISHKLA